MSLRLQAAGRAALVLLLLVTATGAQSQESQPRQRDLAAVEAQAYKQWYDAWATKDILKALERYPESKYSDYLRRWLRHDLPLKVDPSDSRGDYGPGIDTKPTVTVKPAAEADMQQSGKTPLMLLVAEADAEVVKDLLDSKGNISRANVNAKETQHGRTALIYAIWRGNIEIINALLNAGADLTVKDSSGRTAVEHAMLTNNPQVIELLERRK